MLISKSKRFVYWIRFRIWLTEKLSIPKMFLEEDVRLVDLLKRCAWTSFPTLSAPVETPRPGSLLNTLLGFILESGPCNGWNGSRYLRKTYKQTCPKSLVWTRLQTVSKCRRSRVNSWNMPQTWTGPCKRGLKASSITRPGRTPGF